MKLAGYRIYLYLSARTGLFHGVMCAGVTYHQCLDFLTLEDVGTIHLTLWKPFGK
jgi:hypothetical protein